MRKPNYVRITLDTGRVKESFFVEYSVLEAVIQSPKLASQSVAFSDITTELYVYINNVVNRVNNLLKLN